VDAYDTGATRPRSRRARDAVPAAVARQPLWSMAVWAAELNDPTTAAAHLHGHDEAMRIGRDVLDDLDRWTDALRP